MNTILKNASMAGMAAMILTPAATAEVSAGFDFKTAYVSEGTTFNDGPVLQTWIEAYGLGLPEQYGSVMLGAWGNYDFNDYLDVAVAGSFQETDWYGSYTLPSLVENLDLFIGYMEYTYGAGAYDKEFNLGAGYGMGNLDLGLTYYQGVGGFIDTDVYVKLAAGYGIDLTEDLSASLDAHIGWTDETDGPSGIKDYAVGAGISYVLTGQWGLGGSFTYIGQGESNVLKAPSQNLDGSWNYGYDVEWVAALSLSCDL